LTKEKNVVITNLEKKIFLQCVGEVSLQELCALNKIIKFIQIIIKKHTDTSFVIKYCLITLSSQFEPLCSDVNDQLSLSVWL